MSLETDLLASVVIVVCQSLVYGELNARHHAVRGSVFNSIFRCFCRHGPHDIGPSYVTILF